MSDAKKLKWVWTTKKIFHEKSFCDCKLPDCFQRNQSAELSFKFDFELSWITRVKIENEWTFPFNIQASNTYLLCCSEICNQFELVLETTMFMFVGYVLVQTKTKNE
jgi:hypothetical protein